MISSAVFTTSLSQKEVDGAILCHLHSLDPLDTKQPHRAHVTLILPASRLAPTVFRNPPAQLVTSFSYKAEACDLGASSELSFTLKVT